MGWRIEKALTDRSSCQHCGKGIKKGEDRFGKTGMNGGWFHMKCAAAGKPRVFASFQNAAKERKRPTRRARNSELEANLIANPDDPAARSVFADWVQSQGDPWGEILALELAGKSFEAKKLFKKHVGELCGGFDIKLFDWRGGFIHGVRLTGDRAKQRTLLDKIFKLRTALLIRELELHVSPDQRFVQFLVERAPKTLTSLFCELTNAIGQLALPQLVTLLLRPETPDLDAAALAPLFAAKQTPKLTRLSILTQRNAPIPQPILEAFLESPLVKQLDCLVVDGSSSNPDYWFLRGQTDKLAHVRALKLDGATTAQHEAWYQLHGEGLI